MILWLSEQTGKRWIELRNTNRQYKTKQNKT